MYFSKYWMDETLGRPMEHPTPSYSLAPSSASLRGNLVILVKNSIRLLNNATAVVRRGKGLHRKQMWSA